MFEVYANNEYITKGRMTFDDDYNYQMPMSTQNDQLSITNVSNGTTALSRARGITGWSGPDGAFQEDFQANLVTLYHSELPNYAAMIGDFTNQYNLGAVFGPTYIYNAVTNAARSLIYLRGTNQVITYDRAATGSTPTAKAVYMNTTGTPTVSGSTASWPTQSGTQKACYTVLTGQTLSNLGLTPAPSNGPDWELVSTLQSTAGSVTAYELSAHAHLGAVQLGLPNAFAGQFVGGTELPGYGVGGCAGDVLAVVSLHIFRYHVSRQRGDNDLCV